MISIECRWIAGSATVSIHVAIISWRHIRQNRLSVFLRTIIYREKDKQLYNDMSTIPLVCVLLHMNAYIDDDIPHNAKRSQLKWILEIFSTSIYILYVKHTIVRLLWLHFKLRHKPFIQILARWVWYNFQCMIRRKSGKKGSMQYLY